MLIALTYLTLEELASERAFALIQTIFQQLQSKSVLPKPIPT